MSASDSVMMFIFVTGAVLGGLIGLFLLFRKLALWYWKVEEGLAAIRETAQAARETRDAVRALTAAVQGAAQESETDAAAPTTIG